MNRTKEIENVLTENSINDLIYMALKWAKLLRQNILLIGLISIFFGLIGFFIAFFSVPKFKAELRFVVKNESSSYGLSSMLGGLGSVFGANPMGSALERTVEIASSDRIVGAALLSEVRLSGNKEILANSFIRLNKLHKVWGKDSLLRNVEFLLKDTAISSMSYSKRKAIKKLESLLMPINGNGIISKSFDKKSGVVTLSATHENEDFAIVLTNEIFNKLRDFYIEQLTTSSQNNVLILQKKVDSIKYELAKVQSSYARNTDQSFGLLFQEDKVELKKLAVREQMLLAMYAEAQKNLETFRFMNDSAIPTLTVIDMPYSPLKEIKKSKLLYSVVSFLLGGCVAFFYLIIRRWYKSKFLT